MMNTTKNPRRVVPAATTSLSPRGGAKHRTLKISILTALAEAGEGGLTIDELARELGVLKSRVQGWFSGTGKDVKGLKKLAPARWQFLGDPGEASK